MKFSHALKHENKAQATWISICTFSRLFILGFIDRNALAFESLTRLSSPFGGNIRSRIY
ncbi:hypothetical protein GO755_14945 [Spirosoma sp. HMF4905]|uniref:Uncharacterized protein n=1 Tax=Spirosoma arboris TaxID=2682092 RepID=A0A7K1SC19_9BACT|nr:hypothetical protein [Spirosoma arboris]MVM31339.1 hypothetical protein [Spirosoma arboris]